MANPAIQRFVALSIWTLGLLYSGARLMLDVIGYTTAPDDFAQLQARMPNWLDWLFSTPWPVPALLMMVLTGFVIYVCWPQRSSAYVEDRQPDSTPISTTALKPGGDPSWDTTGMSAAHSPQPIDSREAFTNATEGDDHERLELFIVDHVAPACWCQVDLQRAILGVVCRDERILFFAGRGLINDEHHYEFCQAFRKIEDFGSSPMPTLSNGELSVVRVFETDGRLI